MKKLIFCSVFFLVAIGFRAQEINKAKLDSLFTTVEDHEQLMGSLSVYKDGKEIYFSSIGFQDVENGTLADKETKYRIGSITKTFTAVILFQLMEEGKLKLNSKLSEYYPDLPNASRITVESMLSHQSGLFNFTDHSSYKQNLEKAVTKEELLELFKTYGTSFEPGEKTAYSNTNYVLLTFIAEDITGKKYDKLLQERIVKPLRLKNTYYGGKINTSSSEAQSYKKRREWKLDTETHMSIPQGAGAIVSTPGDLNKFYTALFEGKLVKESSLNLMKNGANGKGLGLFAIPFDSKTFYGHTGGIDGFASIAAYNPEEKLAFALTTNGAEMGVNDLVKGILSILYNKEYQLPVFEAKLALPVKMLQSFTGMYATTSMPIKIKIFVEDEVLMGQGDGQASFPLEATADNKFKFDKANLTMEFLPEEKKMVMVQGGKSFEFTRM